MAESENSESHPDEDVLLDPEHLAAHSNYDDCRPEELRRLLRLSERERTLVGLELHDGCAQDLAAAIMFLDLAVSQLPQEPEPALASATQAVRRLRAALQEMRDVIGGIHLPELQQWGFVAALRHLASSDNFPSLTIELELNLSRERLVPSLELAAYRIVQEALRNADRHSGSPRAVVSVTEQPTQLEIQIQDFGRGFERPRVPQNRLGLRGMEQRAALAGGRCEITSQAGAGTTVRVVLPCPAPAGS